MKIQFYIQTENNPAPIYIRFNDGRKFDIRTKSGLVIDPKNWTAGKWQYGKPKSGLKDAIAKEQVNRLKSQLTAIEHAVNEKYNATEDKSSINKDWLNAIFNPEKVKLDNEFEAAPNKLIEYFEYYRRHYYNPDKKNILNRTAIFKIGIVKEIIKEMQRKHKKTYLISDVNEKFLQAFSEQSDIQGYSPNTSKRNFKVVKTICYHARTKGVRTHSDFEKLKLIGEDVDKIYLTIDELNKIEKTVLKEDHLKNARDWLLISCETGQRVSDFLRFTKEMIRIEKGESLIEFKQVKGGKQMTVRLNKRVLAILKKRKGEFPVKMSDQRYNEHIKTVCKIAGLTTLTQGALKNIETLRKKKGMFPKWQLVSSHIGRRSFASNKYGKIPTALLISQTGHGTEQMFLEYIGKTDAQKALDMAKYD